MCKFNEKLKNNWIKYSYLIKKEGDLDLFKYKQS